MPHDVDGLAERLGRFLRGHPSEVAHFDELLQWPGLAGERLQSGLEIQQFHRFAVGFRFHQNTRGQGLDFHVFIAGTLFRCPGPCVVYEYLAHHARGHREKVYSVVESPIAIASQLQVDLVDQRRSLQGMPATLSP